MSGYHRCTRCNSDHMIDGAFLGAPQGPYLVVGVDNHPDHGPLPRAVSTRIHASVCGSCGFVELYANQPAELFEAYANAPGADRSGHART